MSRCKFSKKGANEYYDDNIDRFYEEREEAFIGFLVEQVKKYLEQKKDDNVSVSEFTEEVEEFEFPSASDWLSSEYERTIDECADLAYEEEKDRRMGL